MDLESTLIRAEALFKRFQRLVEAIDKKQNFPAPRLRPGLSSPTSSSNNVSNDGGIAARTTATSPSSQSPRDAAGKEKDELAKVITPELRRLLNREVMVLPKKEAAKRPEGFPR